MSKTVYPFKIGNFDCYALLDGHIYGSAERFFAGPTDKERTAALEKIGMQPDKVPSYFAPLFVDTGTHKVELDTGIGEDEGDFGFVQNNLSSINVDFHAVDIVMISHAHGDVPECTVLDTKRRMGVLDSPRKSCRRELSRGHRQGGSR
jgi:predicted metal-dependent RNase